MGITNIPILYNMNYFLKTKHVRPMVHILNRPTKRVKIKIAQNCHLNERQIFVKFHSSLLNV